MKKLGCMTDLWLFTQLAPPEKREIERLVQRSTFKKGEFLFMEGEPASAIFLITAGRAKLFKVSQGGKRSFLGF